MLGDLIQKLGSVRFLFKFILLFELRCIQLFKIDRKCIYRVTKDSYLGPKHRWCEDPFGTALFIIIIIILQNESHF